MIATRKRTKSVPHLTSILVPWTFALITCLLLRRRAKANKNPLERPLVDRSLILPALCCFAGGLADLGRELDLMANVEMTLARAPDILAGKKIRAKIVKGAAHISPHTYWVRFTAVPPEIAAYFAAFIQQGCKD